MSNLEASLNRLLATLEKQYGPVPELIIEPPACSLCNDTGWIPYGVQYGHENFGKNMRCTNPNCPKVREMFQAQTEKMMQFCTWESSYGSWTFESYIKQVDKLGQGVWDGKRGAYAAAFAFATNGGNPFGLQAAAKAAFKTKWAGLEEDRLSNSVVLTGDVGLGKTGLAVAVVNYLRARCQPVLFIRVQELIRRLQETYHRDWTGESTDTRSRFYASVPYLIIDEFGMKNYSNDRLELVENIIRERDRRGLPFMATTNLTKDDTYDNWKPQIADIIAKSHWVQIGGVKLRQTANRTEAW